jgi:hypothetical protein
MIWLHNLAASIFQVIFLPVFAKSQQAFSAAFSSNTHMEATVYI